MPPALETIAFAIMIASGLVQLCVTHVLWTELWFGPSLILGRALGAWLWPRTPEIAIVSMLSHALSAALLLWANPGLPPFLYGSVALLLALVLPLALRRLDRVADGRGRHRRPLPPSRSHRNRTGS